MIDTLFSILIVLTAFYGIVLIATTLRLGFAVVESYCDRLTDRADLAANQRNAVIEAETWLRERRTA